MVGTVVLVLFVTVLLAQPEYCLADMAVVVAVVMMVVLLDAIVVVPIGAFRGVSDTKTSPTCKRTKCETAVGSQFVFVKSTRLVFNFHDTSNIKYDLADQLWPFHSLRDVTLRARCIRNRLNLVLSKQVIYSYENKWQSTVFERFTYG